ncbi:MAG: helix-turn-helix domain-containing protein [Nocardioides sp.]
MALLDLVGRRWTLRVMWELHTSQPQPLTFRALQDRCEAMSSSVLNRRLSDLREARLVAREPRGYALTAMGSDLVVLLVPLDAWAQRWSTGVGTTSDGGEAKREAK